ncbi:TIGR03617 family F420-dependent LLM class oxidoreductase [Microbacterium alcoholitolerans]|uniref:TIGR03617 family F420-dependent LLM class oxidoreductase n=1 Tax=unclassified Microbacterium TaxID=2609290 RepID=UPI003D165D52
MRIDTTLVEKDLLISGERASSAEAAGLDRVWCTETGVDVFLQAYEIARETEQIEIGTAIAVALARNPMTVAYTAWNIADISDGRFTLGLGSQVRAHIERRFSMPWTRPARQMREFVLALRAIWEAWRTGERLAFEGEHYSHTLMNDFWAPKPHEHRIPIHLAAVGPKMVETAAEVADGIILHSFTNKEYLERVTFPAIERGLARSGRTMDDLEISIPLFMIMGDTTEEIESIRRQVAMQLAFYGSTPSYLPVLEAVGMAQLQPELAALSKSGDTARALEVVPSALIDHFAIQGRPEDMPALATRHLGRRVTRTSSYFGWPSVDPDRLQAIAAEFRAEG